MNSERSRRQRLSALLNAELDCQQNVSRQSEKTIEALREAKAILDESPRSAQPCELLLHWHLESLQLRRASCSECNATFLGYEKHWKACPVCGSTIVKATLDTDPIHTGQTREAMDILQSIKGGK